MTSLHDFSSEFMIDVDFGFNFGADFSRFDESGDVLSGSYEYDGVSCGFSVEGFAAGHRRRRQRWRRRSRRPNRHHRNNLF